MPQSARFYQLNQKSLHLALLFVSMHETEKAMVLDVKNGRLPSRQVFYQKFQINNGEKKVCVFFMFGVSAAHGWWGKFFSCFFRLSKSGISQFDDYAPAQKSKEGRWRRKKQAQHLWPAALATLWLQAQGSAEQLQKAGEKGPKTPFPAINMVFGRHASVCVNRSLRC